jgi:hypothetical protein
VVLGGDGSDPVAFAFSAVFVPLFSEKFERVALLAIATLAPLLF